MPINVVVDISHHNGNVDLGKAKTDGILGVIQKATQGQSGVDPTFQTNRNKANNAGLMFGAYHFATGSDGLKQAQHFLQVVGSFDNTLLVLDFEPNPTGPSMTLEEARAFVTHVARQPVVSRDYILGTTSSSCLEVIRTTCSPSVGSGWPNMDLRRSSRRIGIRGRCGNTPMERRVRSLTASRE